MTDETNTNPNPQSSTGDDSDKNPATQDGTAGRLPKKDQHLFVIPPHPKTEFDEEEFLDLLEGSISLTMEEKKRVISAIPRLNIEQINELRNIFKEERQKFSDLEKEFADDVAKLKREREKEREIAEIHQEEESEESGSVDEAEALKRKLMGGE